MRLLRRTCPDFRAVAVTVLIRSIKGRRKNASLANTAAASTNTQTIIYSAGFPVDADLAVLPLRPFSKRLIG